jgi:hypothetical protein
MRVAVVADLHGQLPAVAPCELLLVAGDLRPLDAKSAQEEESWLNGPFRTWLDNVPAAQTVGIAGNHDFLFERAPQRVPRNLRWTYLQDGACDAGGLTIWGSPWTPWFYDWAFNAPRIMGERFLEERYSAVSEATDVLLLHGPPAGYGDRTASGAHAGSTAALDLIDRIRPRLCVFGHIHEGRGRWHRAGTTLVNCAAVDVGYAPVPDPVVVLDLSAPGYSGQRSCTSGVASCNARAARSASASRQGGAVSWMPIGSPSGSNPARTATLGKPVRFWGIV